MSGYYQQGYGKVTPIDMLPELEDITSAQPYEKSIKESQIKKSRYPGENIMTTEESQRVQKFIRENHASPKESGMYYRDVQNTYMPSSQDQMPPLPPMGAPDQMSGIDIPYSQVTTASEPSCIDCARHASACPVCKSYFNNDKTIYIIAIIVLIAICLLLLKKILDV